MLARVVTGGVLEVRPAGSLRGTVRVPGDKSISHRYAILAALARGTTRITGLSPGADVAATLGCLAALGVGIETGGAGDVRIAGLDRAAFRPPESPLDAANSGTTMRLLAGVLAGCPHSVTLIGDASLSRRPMRRVIEPLTAMGARVESADGRPPLTITGGHLHGIKWRSPVPSAQVKSAVLLAGVCADGRTEIEEPTPTRDHTERAFPVFGLHCDVDGLTIRVEGRQQPRAPAGSLDVPGDASSAAVWAAATAALPGSRVQIEDVGLNPRRLGFIRALERAGARIQVEPGPDVANEPRGSLLVEYADRRPLVIGETEVPDVIDELPVLAAAAALGGRLELSGASELRVKESDRITMLVSGLKTLGVDAHERPDGFVIDGARRPTGGRVDAAGDHRLVMAFTVVALGASGPTTITGADVVAVSYPGFAQALDALRR